VQHIACVTNRAEEVHGLISRSENDCTERLDIRYAAGVELHSPGLSAFGGLPWEPAPKIFQPCRGCTDRSTTLWYPFRVRFARASRPRVARKTGRPWAMELNTFGVNGQEAKTSRAEKWINKRGDHERRERHLIWFRPNVWYQNVIEFPGGPSATRIGNNPQYQFTTSPHGCSEAQSSGA